MLKKMKTGQNFTRESDPLRGGGRRGEWREMSHMTMLLSTTEHNYTSITAQFLPKRYIYDEKWREEQGGGGGDSGGIFFLKLSLVIKKAGGCGG